MAQQPNNQPNNQIYSYQVQILVSLEGSFFLHYYSVMGEEDGISINRRIKQLRKELKLTQNEFAELLSLSQSLITSIELEKRAATERLIKQIADMFNINPQWLKTGKGSKFDGEKDSRVIKLLAIYNNLKPSYQDFFLNQIDLFLKMQEQEDG